MSTMVVIQSYTRQHAVSTSQNLLNLDCSADLESYRRDLGPGVQAKCFEKTSDTIRAQLDDHRASLLQHRRNGKTSRFSSPVPRLEVLQSHTVLSSNAMPLRMTAPNEKYHTASHPRPLRILSLPHAPGQMVQPSRRGSPMPGHVETYPVDLREALERCNQYGHQHRPDTVYEVITNIKSDYMGSSKDVVGRYESLQDANMQATNVFLSNGYHALDDEPAYEVEGDGRLKIRCNANGSTGGCVEINVESAPAMQTLSPKRR